MSKSPVNVGLFVSCLADLSRPQIGFASVKLLEYVGCNVAVPTQTCCGQPAYNNGNKSSAIDIAKATIQSFEAFDHVIVPSASCAGMIKYHYPELLKDDTQWHEKAKNLSERTHELITYLYTIAGLSKVSTEYNGRIYFHESCSARREMRCQGAQELLGTIKNATVLELPHNEECCGFGGLFSVKYDEISNAMVTKKIALLPESENTCLTGLDMGCLLNMSGKLEKQGNKIEVMHISELLALNL